jgi:phospholipid/cholesterol/gamma-HCH transport system substrate-binding protein
MKNKQRRSLTVGLFVTLALIIFITAIYLVGIKENIFGSTVTVSAIFEDVKGLREGDKVRLSGIDIGTVGSIWFLNDNRVIIQMNLEEAAVEFVRKDARATIANEGLMGSKVVMILPGSLASRPVTESDTLGTIEQIDIDDIMKEVQKSSENISVVTGELISITQKINRGDGIFGKIFTDTTFTRNLDAISMNIAEVTRNLNSISEQVNRGQGVMGKLLADTIITAKIDSAGHNFNQIAVNLMEITEQINEGQGVLGRLFTDTALTSNLYLSSKNMEVTTKNLMDLTAKLNNDSSALHLFINDEAFADSLQLLLFQLDEGVEEVTNAAEAIQRSGLIRMFSKDKEKKKNKDD